MLYLLSLDTDMYPGTWVTELNKLCLEPILSTAEIHCQILNTM